MVALSLNKAGTLTHIAIRCFAARKDHFRQRGLPENGRVMKRTELRLRTMSKRKKFDILRVWPEWESSGIWSPPQIDSLQVGEMIAYDKLDLPEDLIERFRKWQYRFDDRSALDPSSYPQPSWESFHAEQRELAHALHAVVGGIVQWESGRIAHTVGEDGLGIVLK